MPVIAITSFCAFFVLVVGVAIWKSRRAAGMKPEEASDFFLGGRSLTWPLIGISIVAANISTEQMVGMAGQAAGSVGLAVSAWQLAGSVGIVLIAFTLLPRFLRAGIYTMPEFLEYRFDKSARAIMAALTVVIYSVVLLPAVLYSGGVTLRAIVGIDLVWAVMIIGVIGMAYSAFGGLKAIAWADLIQVLALLIGGLIVFAVGIRTIGGWAAFVDANADRLHMVLPADNPNLPGTSLLTGMPIVLLYYCGLNQFIVQRNLAAKTLKDGQLGMIFAGGLWLLVPFAVVMPGMIAQQLYAEELTDTTDAAFPTLIKKLISPGISGFIFAAIAGAVTSTLASLLNSASTVMTMDLYRGFINPKAGEKVLVWMGRSLTVGMVVVGCLLAPALDNPRFGGVFQFIQQFQGYIWPGVVAAFVGAFVLAKAPAFSGAMALVLGPLIYGAFQLTQSQGLHDLFFLHQVFFSFLIVMGLMVLMTLLIPLNEPKKLPVREEIASGTEPVVFVAGAAVLLAVAAFFVLFW